MQDAGNMGRQLEDRLNLIESMIAEGRRSTQSWGWTFVLWGSAYYLAMAWSLFFHSAWPWPVTMAIAAVATVVVASRKSGNKPSTTLGRASASIWISAGISMFLLFFALGLSGRLAYPHLFEAVLSAMLGLANGASALLLRWKAQLGCALVWWGAAVASCFGTETQSVIVFVVAVFVCQIAFGVYSMAAGSHEGDGRRQMHA